MQLNTISKSKLHCILVVLILFILAFLSIPLLLIRLANDSYNERMLPVKTNEVSSDGGPVGCGVGFFPCAGKEDKCISQTKQCDNKFDCQDHSDESLCYDSNGIMFEIFKDIIKHDKGTDDGLAIPANCDEELFFEDKCPCNLTEINVIICEHSDLSIIPSDINENVYKIRMNDNKITDIGGVNWPRALRQLALINNSISHIAEATFETAPNLSRLYMANNNLSYIHPMAFNGLRYLATIEIQNNSLSTLPATIVIDKLVLTHLQLMENKIDLDDEMRFSRAPSVREINLDNNQITRIRRHHFSNMTQLRWLSLNNNRITYIDEYSFENDYNLQELNLSFNNIQTINRYIFAHRLNINRLLLSGNPIQTLAPEAFRELLEIASLSLTNIEFSSLTSDTFSYLKMLKFIYFEKFSYCYYASMVRVCRPITDGISTMEDLLAFPTLKYAVWIVASVCVMGNVTVLIWRTISKHEDKTLSLFVRNLSVADLMMGIYLSTIAQKDREYHDKFRLNADSWMSSWQCAGIGFLALLSSELSVFLLTIITIERYRAIVSLRKFEEDTFISRARLSIGLAWIASLLIASYPLLEWLHRNTSNDPAMSKFFTDNGLCLPLHIGQPFSRGWHYSAIVYLGINFTAVILMITLYARMYMIIIDGHKLAKPHLLGSEKRQDAILAIRFFFIVLTDCLCWIPIVVIKMMAFQMEISSSIYGWLVVFIIPINSALNPIVYTLANPSTYFCRCLGRFYHWLNITGEQISWRMKLASASSSSTSSSGRPAACPAGNRAGHLAKSNHEDQPAHGHGRAARAPRGSNYSSSRSSTSISAGSEVQLMSHMVGAGRRQRAKAGSSSTAYSDHFESAAMLMQSKGSSKSSFESALLPPSYHECVNGQQQQVVMEHTLRVVHAYRPDDSADSADSGGQHKPAHLLKLDFHGSDSSSCTTTSSPNQETAPTEVTTSQSGGSAADAAAALLQPAARRGPNANEEALPEEAPLIMLDGDQRDSI